MKKLTKNFKPMRSKKITLSMIALAALTMGGMSSCTMEDAPSINKGNSMLAKAPKVLAYSGNHTWGNVGTRSANVNANEWNQTWDCPPRPAEDLTEDELAELKDLLSKGQPTKNEIVIPFENYYVQQIYKGEDEYNTRDRCYQDGCSHINDQTKLGSAHMDKLVAYNPHEEFQYWPANDFVTIEYEHINNFNSGTNANTPGECGCGEVHFGTTLMTDMPTEGIDPDKQFGFHETWGTAHDYNNYIIVEYKGYYYVGFDYEAHKYDQTTHNHGEGLDIERDWNFTDWIVRITPAYPKGTTPENPENPTPGPTDPGKKCDKCGHPEHGDTCSECKENEGCNNEDDPVVTPETPDDKEDVDTPTIPGHKHYNEVEVNLHGTDKNADKDGDYLESHLSIHVRYPGDVKVFIPVPKEFYCDADDMAIVQKHEGNLFVHGGEDRVVTFNVGGKDVSLHIEFESDGIYIWTEGIDEDVIKYCRETFDDGITFEIWNYFNDSIDLDTLKGFLNQATVKFLGEDLPDYYINAFTDNVGDPNKANDDDCTVSIVDEQRGDYGEPEEGEHLNGSRWNEIYKNKSVKDDSEE